MYIIYLASYSGDLGNIIELENNVQFLLWTDKLTQRVSFLATSYNSPVGQIIEGARAIPMYIVYIYQRDGYPVPIINLDISQCRQKYKHSQVTSKEQKAIC